MSEPTHLSSEWDQLDPLDELAGTLAPEDPLTDAVEDRNPLDARPRPADEPPAAADGELAFACLEQWVDGYLLAMYRRAVSGTATTWCSQWWRHPEAVLRLEALWRAWEYLRLEPTTGMSVWFRDHCDQHMPQLLSADGPLQGLQARRSPPAGGAAAEHLTAGRLARPGPQRPIGAGGPAVTARRTVCWALAGGVMVVLGGLVSLALIGGAAQASCAGSGATVSAAGEPPLVQIYIAAARRYGLGRDGYAYLAAINKRETSFGTDMATSPPALAEGWMAFEPASWREYGVAVNHTGAPDPFNADDAIYAAARLLRADHAPADWSGAIFAYNHADWYVAEVTAIAHTYLGAHGLQTLAGDIRAAWGGREPTGVSRTPQHQLVDQPVSASSSGCCPGDGVAAMASCSSATSMVLPIPGDRAVIEPNGVARPPASAPKAVQTLISAGDQLIHYRYSYAGGHCVAAMNSLQALDQCPGSEENGGPGFDCSGATGWVLWQLPVGRRFLDDSPQASGAMMSEGGAGAGRWVTVFAAGGHVFLGIAGIALDTSWQWQPGTAPASPDTGPRWVPEVAAYHYEDQSGGSYTGQYVMRHPVGL